jgi:hypothetical protein
MNLHHDLIKLRDIFYANEFDIKRLFPLLQAVLLREPDDIIWARVYYAVTETTPSTETTTSPEATASPEATDSTGAISVSQTSPLPGPLSSFPPTPGKQSTSNLANSAENRNSVDPILKKELGAMYMGITEFFDTFFGGFKEEADAVFKGCQTGDNPLYQDKSGWQGWLSIAKEEDVLKWFSEITGKLSKLAAEYQPASTPRRRLLTQPNKPLRGATAHRKLDTGFVGEPSAGANSPYTERIFLYRENSRAAHWPMFTPKHGSTSDDTF